METNELSSCLQKLKQIEELAKNSVDGIAAISRVDTSVILSDDALALVMSKLGKQDLGQAALTSRRWANIAFQLKLRPVTINSLEIPIACAVGTGEFEKVTALLKEYGKGLLFLNTRYVKICDQSLEKLMEYCPNLDQVLLPNAEISDEAVLRIVQRYPKLRTLSLAGCQQVSDKAVLGIGQHCKQLQRLSLEYCTKVSDSAMKQMLASCGKDLHELRLSHCHQVLDETVNAIAKHCTHLRRLSLATCHKVSDAARGQIVESCQGLEEFDISDSLNVRDETVEKIAKKLFRLQIFNMAGDRYVYDKAIQQVAMHCRDLEELNLSGCDGVRDGTLSKLSENRPPLRYLNLGFCTQVSDTAVSHLVAVCHGLEELDLMHCEKVSDLTAFAIAESCPRLQKLHLDCCKVSDRAIQQVATRCPKLKVLTLTRCKQIGDGAVLAIAEHCSDLVYFSIRACRLVSDHSMQQFLLKRGRRLKHLDLSHCLLSNQIVHELAQHSPGLLRLDLDGCTLLTDSAFSMISGGFQNLQEISLERCEMIGDETVMALANHLSLGT